MTDRPDNRPESPSNAPTDPTTMTDPSTTEPETDRPLNDADASDSRSGRLSASEIRALLDRILLGALVVLALIAGWSAYGHVGTAIRTWLDPAYQPIMLAAFNFAVLLVALAGAVHQLRKLRGEESGGHTPIDSSE